MRFGEGRDRNSFFSISSWKPLTQNVGVTIKVLAVSYIMLDAIVALIALHIFSVKLTHVKLTHTMPMHIKQ